MKPDNDQPKVTLEQLLRVKRAEKPSPEFWAQFERELRVKQLAAIVEPRPWWAPFIRVGSRLARYQVPLGAAAVLVLTFVSVREYESLRSNAANGELPQRFEANTGQQTSADLFAAADMPASAAGFEGAAAGATSSHAEVAVEATAQLAQGVPVAAEAHVAHAERLIDSSPALSESWSDAVTSFGSRMVAAHLDIVRNSEPEIVPAFALSRVSGAHLPLAATPAPRQALTATQSGPVSEPLSLAGAEVANRRSSRLLASALPATATVVAAAGVRSDSALRLNRSISEERLYDSMRRGGIIADRTAIKF